MANGSCQFIALAAQLAGGYDSVDVRRRVVRELEDQKDVYKAFVEGPYDAYVTEMGKDTTWGDNVTLQAAADTFNAVITLSTDFADQPSIVVRPQRIAMANTPAQEVALTFTVECHYSSSLPQMF
jgi:hypothetical protein